MTRPPDFDDVVGDAPPEERERLRRVHDLLLAVGPPPELPPALGEAPGVDRPRERPPMLTTLPRRRLGATLTAAVGIAAAAFAIGYFAAPGEDGASRVRDVAVVHTLEMKPTKALPDAAGVLRLGKEEEGGNTPLVLTVTGLEDLGNTGYYELWLTREGKRAVSCGTFVADEEDLTVRLNAPYTLEEFAGWVVVQHIRGQKTEPVVLTT